MGWLRTRVRAGWLILAVAIVLFAASIALQLANPDSTFNYRILGGASIAAGAGGIGLLARYWPAMRTEDAARRVVAEARDERKLEIRRRAGNRAWWTASVLIWLGLMWASFPANSGLPKLEGDRIWDFLAAAYVIPFAIYAGSITLGERNS
jgi:hypothetical protein